MNCFRSTLWLDALIVFFTKSEVRFLCPANFLELRYELPRGRRPAARLVARNFFRERVVIGQFQFQIVLSIPFTPIAEVPREGQLVQVEIERGNTFSSFKQRHNDVHGKCGFAAAALLVANNDDVRPATARSWLARSMYALLVTRPIPAEKNICPKKLTGAKRYFRDKLEI